MFGRYWVAVAYEGRPEQVICFMADALFITHIQIVGQQPDTAWWGTIQTSFVELTETLFTPAGGGSCSPEANFKARAHNDPDKFFTDTDAQ